MPRSIRSEPYPAGKAKSRILAPLIDRRMVELLDRAVEIDQADARAAGTLSYVSRIFCLTSLPHRDPGERLEWKRQNGAVTLRVRPGLIGMGTPQERYGYPFGVMPRYLLAWMTTEVKQGGPAVQDDGLTLALGGSLHAFLRQIGLDSNGGGRRGNATRLRDQITRLALSSIIVTEGRETKGGQWNARGEQFMFMREVSLWWSDKDTATDTLWPNTIRLSTEWRDSILDSAVPLDTRALGLLQRTRKAGPLALDLYYWLAHRIYTLNHGKRSSVVVPWAHLANQFGGQYRRTRAFKEAATDQLQVVLAAYPAADVTPLPDGLLLKRSALPVAERPVIDV